MEQVSDDTLITIERSKLPASLVALVDVTHPLPAGVTFFERKYVPADLGKTAAIAIGVGLLGVLITIYGVVSVVDDLHTRHTTVNSHVEWKPLGVGLVCLFAAWVMLSSIGSQYRLMRRQRAGEATRVGIFLTPDYFLEANEHAFCAIPRARFQGLTGGTVRYTVRGQEKSLRLPRLLVTGEAADLHAAVQHWASL